MTLKLLVVGEGERDRAAVPCLVEGLLGVSLECQFERWPRLHGAGRGYAKKLQFAVLQVANRGLQGLVGTVDSDDRHVARHLPKLQQARMTARATGNITPTALGEAIPHLEAWLLDDPVAVRQTLGFEASLEIKSPTKVESPKDELTGLCSRCSTRQPMTHHLATIAQQISMTRCIHAEQTGFKQFAADVRQELEPLTRG
jgi:hypothetical protein